MSRVLLPDDIMSWQRRANERLRAVETRPQSIVTAGTVFGGEVVRGDSTGTLATQSAVESAVDASSGRVFIGPGTWLHTARAQIDNNNLIIEGAGRDSTFIQGSVSDGLWRIGNGDTGTTGENMTIRDLTFYQKYTGTLAHSIIYADGHNMTFENVDFLTDGSNAASSAYFFNNSATAGATSGLRFINCRFVNLATLTAIQVSGVIWRHDDLSFIACYDENVNNLVVPTSDCNKEGLVIDHLYERTTTNAVTTEGPDVWNFTSFSIDQLIQSNNVTVNGDAASQNGLLIEAGGPSNFAGKIRKGVITNCYLRAPLFLIADGTTSTQAEFRDVRVDNVIVEQIRTTPQPNGLEITGPLTAGKADNLSVFGMFDNGVRFPGTSMANWTNWEIQDGYRHYKVTSTDVVESSRVPADTVDRYSRDAAGATSWGPGSGAVDTNLYRASANVLQTDDAFRAAANAHQFGTGVSGSGAMLEAGDLGDGGNVYLVGKGSATDVGVVARAKGAGVFQIETANGSTVLGRFDANGNFRLFGMGASGSGGVIAIPDATAPSANPTGGTYLFSESGVLKARSPSGVITSLSPGMWNELGRTTLGTAGDTITVSSLPARKHLMLVVCLLDTGGTIRGNLTFNNDTGSNYAYRRSAGGGADTTSVSQANILITSGPVSFPHFMMIDVMNYAASEKLAIVRNISQQTAGAGTAPDRQEIVGKWANTADQITRVDVTNPGTGDFAIGSEVIVLGAD